MLNIYLSEHLIGQLSCSRSGWALEYDTRWQTSSQGFDLDPHLPRDTGVIADTAETQPVCHFLEYLPSEAARSTPKAAAAALGRLAQTTPHLDDLLALVPSGLKPYSGRAGGLSERDLVLQFQQAVGRPPRSMPLRVTEPHARYDTDTAETTEEISLPFLASNGLPVSVWLGWFSAPTNAAQSSHFMWLDSGGGAYLPYTAINHYWATLLDRSIRLGTPFIGLCQFSGTAAVVRHLGRTLHCKGNDAALVQARHVVSAVQLLGLSPRYRPLPIAVEQVAQCASLCADPASVTVALFRWMVFCPLIGGRSASAGTLYFHISTGDTRLAAHDHLFYAAVYTNEQSADKLSPDTQARYEAIDQDALLAPADHLGYDASQARCELLRLISMLAPQSSFVAAHLSQALGHSPTHAVEIDFLARIHRRVSETARQLGGKTAEV